jgi:cytochrome subunit of sulfide dehydrogenase
MKWFAVSQLAGIGLLAGAAGLAWPARAQDAQALALKSLAATCANCHGTGGRAVADSAVPGLAGMPRAYAIEQMKAFKNGSRPATVMHQLARGYSDEQIEQIAAYFAAQPR